MKNALKAAGVRWGQAWLLENPGGARVALPGKKKRLEAVEVTKPAGEACKSCPLLRRRCVPTEFAAPGRRLLTIVGEAPGRTEVNEGRPFSPNGQSGRFLEQQLSRIGIRRDEVTWTNAALCEAKTEAEVREASKHCMERLQRELGDSSIVTPVGAFALSSTLRSKKRMKITRWRGFVLRDELAVADSKQVHRLIVPTVHPAFVLRSDTWGPVIQTDFDRLKRVLESGWSSPFADPRHEVLKPKSLKGLKHALIRLAHGGATHVAIDVETPMDTRATKALLVCLALSDGSTTVAIPWKVGGENNWKPYFGAGQKAAAEALTKFLKRRTAVTHNGPGFDHIVLARHGIHVSDWDDTLYAHHAFAGHMPQGLSHVVSMYLDAPAWKEKKHKSYKGLLRYNAHDAQFTALAWQAMQPELADERGVYERNRQAASLCAKMQINGMFFDRPRARLLSKFLKKRIKTLRAKANALLGKEINLDSPVQLRKIYFEELEAPVFFRTKKNNPSLAIDAIRAYITYSDPKLRDLSRLIIDYRSARTTLSTFIRNPAKDVDSRSRVHPDWRPTQVGGRFKCSNPNLTNLTAAHRDPTRELGGVRSLYRAKPGHLLVGFDCLTPSMRVLYADLTWRRIGDVKVGDALIGFDEKLGKSAKVRPSIVNEVHRTEKKCVRIWTDRGMVEASYDHQWVVRPARGSKASLRRWLASKDLRPGDRISFFAQPWETDRSFEAGYLAGFFDGEGYISARKKTEYGTQGGGVVGYGQVYGPTHDGVMRMLQERGFDLAVRHRAACVTEARGKQQALAMPWIRNGDGMRFVGSIRPQRLLAKSQTLWDGIRTWSQSERSRPATVLRIEKIGVHEVVAVGTSTNTFIAEGMLSHNCKQIEMRVAAYFSGDEVMIKAVESSDLHAVNANIVFKDAFDPREYVALKSAKARDSKQERQFQILEKLRDVTKRVGFALIYGAEPNTIVLSIRADGLDIEDSQVEKVHFELRNAYFGFFRFMDALYYETIRLGYVSCPFTGRKRWVGHAPKPNEVMNFPIQAGAAAHVVGVLLKLDAALPSEALLVNYGYDAAIYEVPKRLAESVGATIRELAEQPVTLNGRRVVFPIDLKVGERWSELK